MLACQTDKHGIWPNEVLFGITKLVFGVLELVFGMAELVSGVQ